MRLVEVVMLMGAQCVSPVEHTQMMTDAAKVQCAVVIEKDTDRGTMTVTPGEAANDPQVVAAIERFRVAPADPLNAGSARVVPAWAPAGSPSVEIKPPVSRASTVPAPIVPPTDDPVAAAPEPSPPAPAAAEAITPPPAAAKAQTTAVAPAAPRAMRVATLAPPPQKPRSFKGHAGGREAGRTVQGERRGQVVQRS